MSLQAGDGPEPGPGGDFPAIEKDGSPAAFVGSDHPPRTIWASPGGQTLSAITFAASVGAFASQQDPCTLGAMLSATLYGWCLVTGLEDPLPYRVLNAASLTACALALSPNTPTALPATFLAIVGTSRLSDVVRVVAREPQQGKGLFQLVITIPAIIAMRYNYDGSLYSWHPVVAILGTAFMVSGVAVQRSGRQNWLHFATSATACACTLTAVGAIIGSKIQEGEPHLQSFHTWCGTTAAASVLLQVMVSVPTMWPGCRPAERSLVGLHSTWGHINVALLALSIVTGFAAAYGWSSTPTVLTTSLMGGTLLLLDTPLWKASGADGLSL
eukprot:GGOE01045598.1.p1 GENE.GGOE01045598.1~~GGOE01045598.1.p1  ORF type:complete len:328 (-),score=80.90 GGOE01045598.1:153-1136(-)